MPQGCAKKIQVQLLLPDFPLQFFDPSLLAAARCRQGRHREPDPTARWSPARAQCRGTTRSIAAVPVIEKLRPNAEFLRQGLHTHCFAHAPYRRELEVLRPAPLGSPSRLRFVLDLLRHTHSPFRTVCVFRVSVYGFSLQRLSCRLAASCALPAMTCSAIDGSSRHSRSFAALFAFFALSLACFTASNAPWQKEELRMPRQLRPRQDPCHRPVR